MEYLSPDFRKSNRSMVKYSAVWREGEMQDTDTKQPLSSLQNSNRSVCQFLDKQVSVEFITRRAVRHHSARDPQMGTTGRD